MEIISEPTSEVVVDYYLDYDYAHETGSGFSFQCDAEGNLLPEVTDAGRENYAKCLANTHRWPVVCKGVKEHHTTIDTPAIGRCVCGGEVWLEGFTNTCACGRDYNWNGDLLAPREQWGEETGETEADILCGDY